MSDAPHLDQGRSQPYEERLARAARDAATGVIDESRNTDAMPLGVAVVVVVVGKEGMGVSMSQGGIKSAMADGIVVGAMTERVMTVGSETRSRHVMNGDLPLYELGFRQRAEGDPTEGDPS